ncbi:hypothetical protein [Paraburkholderia sp. SIMBA_054]|uniref:hypothetical protein n=1 Tax=Paraburkholderia sp. SIMBA_054 TaxID=3085795 RepID=UPI00397AF144
MHFSNSQETNTPPEDDRAGSGRRRVGESPTFDLVQLIWDMFPDSFGRFERAAADAINKARCHADQGRLDGDTTKPG